DGAGAGRPGTARARGMARAPGIRGRRGSAAHDRTQRADRALAGGGPVVTIVQAQAMPVFASRREDRTGRDTQARLEGAPVHVDGVNVTGKPQPEEIAALWLRHRVATWQVRAQRREREVAIGRQAAAQSAKVPIETAAAQ